VSGEELQDYVHYRSFSFAAYTMDAHTMKATSTAQKFIRASKSGRRIASYHPKET
jgi:hypothetical protein